MLKIVPFQNELTKNNKTYSCFRPGQSSLSKFTIYFLLSYLFHPVQYFSLSLKTLTLTNFSLRNKKNTEKRKKEKKKRTLRQVATVFFELLELNLWCLYQCVSSL